MSMSFRPVREVWGAHSDQFIDHDALVQLLQNIAEKFGTSQVGEYGETTVIWIEKGLEFLAFLGSEDFNADVAHDIECEVDDLNAVMDNMRNMRVIWQREVDGDGSLCFYID
jgi:hypothetical protein